MSQVTRFNGDYNITGVDASGNVIVSANTLLVNGNLVVTGASSSIASTDTQIADNVITLNKGESGAGVTLTTAGLDIDRGSLTTASIYWNEHPGFIMSVDGSYPIPPRWEITDGSGNFSPIASAASFSVINDIAPKLGGNFDVLGSAIYNSAGDAVPINSSLAISNVSSAPLPEAGYNVVYADTPGAGGSGVFVTNETVQGEELITKSKAIIFALIM